jgi:hypothetical protein
MKPLAQPAPPGPKTLVELPCNWYMEDSASPPLLTPLFLLPLLTKASVTPMQFLPAAPNSHGYVPANSIMEMWKSRFEYLYNEYDEEERKDGKGDFIFPLVLHPDTSGMAHIIGMIDKMIGWLRGWGDEVTFCKFEEVAREWKNKQLVERNRSNE